MLETTKQRLNNNVFTLPKFCIVTLLILVMFIWGSLADFSVSKQLYIEWNRQNAGHILSVYFSIPSWFITCLLGWNVIFSGYKIKNDAKWACVLVFITGIIAVGGGGYGQYGCYHTLDSIYGSTWDLVNALVLTIASFLGAFFLSFYGFRKIEAKQLFKVCFAALIAMAIVGLLGELGKNMFCRPRPNYVFEQAKPLESFKNWYEPLWFSNFSATHKSFPSGHTVTASYAIIGICVISKLDLFKKKYVNNCLLFVAIATTLVVAFARIIAGKHWLTDVSGALGIGIIVCFFTFVIEEKIRAIA